MAGGRTTRSTRLESDRVAVAAGKRATLPVRVTNTGDTRWLTGIPNQAGQTSLGAHLYAAARGGPAGEAPSVNP